MPKPHLLDQTADGLRDWFVERGLPAYRASQVWRWLFQRRVGEFAQMTDLPETLRSQLAEQWAILTTRTVQHQQSDDGTEKLLLETADGERIEGVLLRDEKQRRTICVSTQVGCAMGCAFCASGLGGFVRNLTTGEIVEEMLSLERLLGPKERLSHIVVMGMGEPLANLDALLPALATATARDGLGISARRVTVSTVGLPPGIRRLAEAGCPYHLAVSLHAADDRLRSELVPTNRRYPIASVLTAADNYFEKTGRRVTYEYVLLGGVNDQPDQARQLVGLLQGRPVLVNVIVYNPVTELTYHPPTATTTARFVEYLRQGGLNVKIRYRKGGRIDAACGQLRRRG